jgi:hypothetical protein
MKRAAVRLVRLAGRLCECWYSGILYNHAEDDEFFFLELNPRHLKRNLENNIRNTGSHLKLPRNDTQTISEAIGVL